MEQLWWEMQTSMQGSCCTGEGQHRVRAVSMGLQPMGAQGAIGGVVDGKAGRHLQQSGAQAPVQPARALVPHDRPHRVHNACVVLCLCLRGQPRAHQIQRICLRRATHDAHQKFQWTCWTVV